MPEFSPSSKNKLALCHPDLVILMQEVIKGYDCIILCGARSDFDQVKAFAEGKSKIDGVKVKSLHQIDSENPLSRAVDVAPFPLDWNDAKRFYHFGGYVQGIAKILFQSGKMKHQIRWGGDWDSDRDFKDNSFNDLPHFELIPN